MRFSGRLWLAVLFVASSTSSWAQLDDAQWVHPDADMEAVLSHAPTECLALPDDPAKQQSVLTGRAAFRSSTLMGGHAARRGLSCNSCHRNGHGNPDFFIAALSDQPGNVDVTNGVFSSLRDDSVFNPIPIPNLLDAGNKSEFGTMIQTNNLRAFITGILSEEFDARLPPEPVFDGLVAYVNALRSDTCPDEMQAVQNLKTEWRDVEAFFDLLVWHHGQGNAETINFMIGTLRHQLGRVSQRLDDDEKRLSLSRLSRQIKDFEKEPTGEELARLRVSLDQLDHFPMLHQPTNIR
jgi:hypothetical protein